MIILVELLLTLGRVSMCFMICFEETIIVCVDTYLIGACGGKILKLIQIGNLYPFTENTLESLSQIDMGENPLARYPLLNLPYIALCKLICLVASFTTSDIKVYF
ncbi:hypothetical protein SAY86_025131 [Trapa natans]|uniref:Uncharacterized protein n=1 Tax=Trapa natans TaxID=22666 RepID=A0AAN7M7F5_TRANT|nr:hypothetical protein SAY86_025131 [Trapa natans]